MIKSGDIVTKMAGKRFGASAKVISIFPKVNEAIIQFFDGSQEKVAMNDIQPASDEVNQAWKTLS